MRWRSPGRSCVITSTRVLCGEHSSSISILVSTFTFGVDVFLRPQPVPQHAIEVRFVEQHIVDACLESLPFRQIQFQRPETVRKEKCVHDDSRADSRTPPPSRCSFPTRRARRPSWRTRKGRSKVTSVSSYQCRPRVNSSCTGSSPRWLAISMWRDHVARRLRAQ